MFKKLIAAGAILAFFACTSIDDTIKETNEANEANKKSSSSDEDELSSSDSGQDSNNDSSSSEQGNGDISSSSSEAEPITIASLNGDGKSEMFKTYTYVFALDGGAPEDLTPFWDIEGGCSAEKQDTKPASTCQLPMTDAILQHSLTNRYSPLHYQAEYSQVTSIKRSNVLYRWNLTGDGDEATLGINVYSSDDNVQSIGDLGITTLNDIVAFEYKYAGGAHEFRVVATDNDFWYYEVPAVPITIDLTSSPPSPAPESEYVKITIPINELIGNGSFADADATFDISKVTKFLWAVKYDETKPENNKGSLAVYDLKAQKP